ncbi:MAG: PEP/pyruvate-binding domain-containing protein [Planctomycetota bacterium]|jgi:phosphoglucan,water dikinase
MKPDICIGNQTAYAAPDPLGPFHFAVSNGFDAFEWFSDKKEYEDGGLSGWEEADFSADTREALREFGEAAGIRFSVHAPWQANPLNKEGIDHLEISIDFAQDIGADVVVFHICMDDGPAGLIRAMRPIMAYAAEAGVKLALENTPYTLPQQVNAIFAGLREIRDETDHVGLCFDMGHANVCSATQNDYIGFFDALDRGVPVFHIHMHENYGDEDSHLTVFTGPAGTDEGGIRALIDRLHKKSFAGSIILEQWPEPPELLSDAGEYLRELMELPSSRDNGTPLPETIALRPAEELAQFRKKKPTRLEDAGKPPLIPEVGPEAEAAKARELEKRKQEVEEVLPEQPASAPAIQHPVDEAFIDTLVAASQEQRSWRGRLQWVRDRILENQQNISRKHLACLSIYLRFLGTGSLICEEDGGHYRPCHHAEAALEIEEALSTMEREETQWLLRRIIPWLPSVDEEFRRSEPLTRIRDIAHRDDIPQNLKSEIKHRLQNKLHRCAGPEDLKTSSELLGRITASGSGYSAEFVREFAIFHDELTEFFNATGLDSRLHSLNEFAAPALQELINPFIQLKHEDHDTEAEILALLEALTSLRRAVQKSLTEESDPHRRQRFRLTDVSLEDYAFPLLSEAANLLETAEADVEIEDWDILVRLTQLALQNVAMSSIEPDECGAIEEEFSSWGMGFSQEDRFSLLRVKATFDRTRRLAENYTDRINQLFPPYVSSLGTKLGVAKHAIEVFCEGDIRGNLIFQLSKLVELGLKTVRAELDLPPWEAIVPGTAYGKMIRVADLEELATRKDTGPFLVLVDEVEGDEEVPSSVKGILLGHAVPHLSHLGVRARQGKIAFAASDIEGSLSAFNEHLDTLVKLTVTPEGIQLDTLEKIKEEKRMSGMHRQVFALPSAELAATIELKPLAESRALTCGAKAESTGQLLGLAESSNGLFKAVDGLVLPFGCMEAALDQAHMRDHYEDCVAAIQEGNVAEMGEELKYLRRMLRGVCLPTSIDQQLIEVFGHGTPLAVRSSANGEDLEEMAGAGLYNSIVGVTPGEATSAVAQVWASLWSRPAAMSRQQAGIPHKDIRMAVMIQRLVLPESCFILHTVDPITQDRNTAFAELAPGLGDILASAGQPGTPYRIRASRDGEGVELTAMANYSTILHPQEAGGAQWQRVSYADQGFSQSPEALQGIGKRLAQISNSLEESLGAPQDAEGVLAGEEIYLVQTRPEQGLSR